MKIGKRTARELINEVSSIIDYDINIMDERGTIMASTDPSRAGQFHEGAHLVITRSLPDLSVYYDGQFAGCRKGINLPILSDGEIIGVVGHNGAGKTTLSRTLCGLHKEASGQFLWNEKPQDRKERLRRSYMVMQDVNFELFADSVEAECSFGIRNPDKSLIETTMDSLGLLPYRTHHPNTLSGGQKQRVAVAVSMICGKELLVFDEPTSGLDFDSMEQVALLIQKLSAMGKVIFVVTHDYEFVCRTCSRVLHIDHGEQCDDLPLVPDNEENLKKLFSI